MAPLKKNYGYAPWSDIQSYLGSAFFTSQIYCQDPYKVASDGLLVSPEQNFLI